MEAKRQILYEHFIFKRLYKSRKILWLTQRSNTLGRSNSLGKQTKTQYKIQLYCVKYQQKFLWLELYIYQKVVTGQMLVEQKIVSYEFIKLQLLQRLQRSLYLKRCMTIFISMFTQLAIEFSFIRILDLMLYLKIVQVILIKKVLRNYQRNI